MPAIESPMPERACGSCNACCQWLHIDTPEFGKPPGLLCRHAGADGCRLHPRWPPVCAGWYCAWRLAPGLPEAWRPDRCGFLITSMRAELPAAFPPQAGLFIVIFWPVAMVLTPSLVAFIRGLVRENRPVFLQVPGPPGYRGAQFFVNGMLGAMAERPDDEVTAALVEAVNLLEEFAFEPAVLTHAAPLQGAPD